MSLSFRGIARVMPESGSSYETGSGGRSLADRMAEGPLPLTAALAYAAAVARALGQLHSEGLTHGNIAPAAIRLTPNGVILLPPSGRAQLPCRCEDVSAFGALLGEMLTCSHSAGGRVHEAASRLASGCLASREAAADLCKLSIQLRVLQLQARVLETQGTAVPPRPEPELNTPAPSAPVKCLPVLEDPAGLPRPFEECPRCIGPVFPSSPCSPFVRLLGVRILRCHWCYHRYFRLFGIRFSREH
jgi:serine/threonine protein kinase